MYRIGKEEVAAVERVVNTKQLFRINTEGREVLQFEEELAKKIGVKKALYMSSGTAALVSILTCLGIGPGDEVIVPAYTFISTPIAVLNAGAIPVLVEIDESLTMDAEDVKKKITDRTKAIMPVHLNGMPCNMDGIMKIAKENNLFVVEDACQADGGTYKGKRLGSLGTAGAMSFNHFKIISAGEGGAVLTDDEGLLEKVLIYHDVGSSYWSYERELSYPMFVGSQFRSCEIMAAIMREQLKKLDGILFDLRRVQKIVMDKISGAKNIKINYSHDIEGDCGVVVPLNFESEAKARAFTEKAGTGMLPIDIHKHVFVYWQPILEKRGAFNEKMNPYNFKENQGGKFEMTKESGPNSLDILSRSVLLYMNPDWTDAQAEDFAKKVIEAAAVV